MQLTACLPCWPVTLLQSQALCILYIVCILPGPYQAFLPICAMMVRMLALQSRWQTGCAIAPNDQATFPELQTQQYIHDGDRQTASLRAPCSSLPTRHTITASLSVQHGLSEVMLGCRHEVHGGLPEVPGHTRGQAGAIRRLWLCHQAAWHAMLLPGLKTFLTRFPGPLRLHLQCIGALLCMP